MNTDDKIERILNDIDNWDIERLRDYVREDIAEAMDNESEPEIDYRYSIVFEGK